MKMKDLYLDFLESGACECCGSQRCDQSPEWISGCQKWKEFLEQQTKQSD